MNEQPASETDKPSERGLTFADHVSKEEAEAEYRRLCDEGYSDAEARAMVYEEPSPHPVIVQGGRNG